MEQPEGIEAGYLRLQRPLSEGRVVNTLTLAAEIVNLEVIIPPFSQTEPYEIGLQAGPMLMVQALVQHVYVASPTSQ